MVTTAFALDNRQGRSLAARLERPEGPIRASAVFAHCFTCGKDSSAAVRVSRALAARGIATLRFDFAGVGQSGGAFSETTFSTNLDDLVAAADALRERVCAPALLVGHSLGGAAVLAAAARIPEVKAVATIGAPASPAHVEHNFRDAIALIEEHGRADVKLGGRQIEIGRGLLDDVRAHDQESLIASLQRALLLLHAPRDQVVGVENAAAIFAAAKHPKSFISLDDSDHFLSRAADAEYAAMVIASWAERYLPPTPVPAANQSGPADIHVAETGTALYANLVRSGRHVFTAGEPASVGGDDSGPSPYDLLAASLGACTSMTVRMYADRKGWPLTRVSASVRHEKTHAPDAAAAEDGPWRADGFEVEITLDGPLSGEQRARLAEIADKCPVHRTLETGSRVTTKLREE